MPQKSTSKLMILAAILLASLSARTFAQSTYIPGAVSSFFSEETGALKIETNALYGCGVIEGKNAQLELGRFFCEAVKDRSRAKLFGPSGSFKGSESLYAKQGQTSVIGYNENWGAFSLKESTGDASSIHNGYAYRPISLTFGQDAKEGNLLLGIAGQYADGMIEGKGDWRTRTNIREAAFSLYGGYKEKDVYIMGSMQYATGQNRENTIIADSSLIGAYGSVSLGTALELGRTFKCKFVEVTPHLGLDYMYYNSGGFTERGDYELARSFGSTNCTVAEIPLGFRFEKKISGGNGKTLTPSVDLMYVRSLGDNVPRTTANFVSQSHQPWEIVGSEIGREAFKLNAGLNAGIERGNWIYGLAYNFETRENYLNQKLNASIGCKW